MPRVKPGTPIKLLSEDVLRIVGEVEEEVALDIYACFLVHNFSLPIKSQEWPDKKGWIVFVEGLILRALYKQDGKYYWIDLTEKANDLFNVGTDYVDRTTGLTEKYYYI